MDLVLKNAANLPTPATKVSALADVLKKVRERAYNGGLPGFFPTPPGLANEMAELLDVRPGMTVLEPSAGIGSLVDAVKVRLLNTIPEKVETVVLKCVESNSELAEVLRCKQYHTACEDFMGLPIPGNAADRIIMNPPFEDGQDRKHVMKAYEHLTPGGVLVALLSPGSFVNKGTEGFVKWFTDRHGHAIQDATGETVRRNAFNAADAFRRTGNGRTTTETGTRASLPPRMRTLRSCFAWCLMKSLASQDASPSRTQSRPLLRLGRKSRPTSPVDPQQEEPPL